MTPSMSAPGWRRFWVAAVSLGCVLGCQKSGEEKLPGQSDVPPPDEPTTGQRACQGVEVQDSTLFASKDGGWGMVLPGQGWELDCPDMNRGKGKLASNRGETLLVTITRVDNPPLDPNVHLDQIYRRAVATLPKAGASAGEPKFVVAQATPKSPQKPVLVYQVHAAELEQGGFKSYHGWSILRTTRGDAFECHMSATIRKDIDWAETLSKYLATCLPAVAE
jgi:hypothetical protein